MQQGSVQATGRQVPINCDQASRDFTELTQWITTSSSGGTGKVMHELTAKIEANVIQDIQANG